jgi:hypothetical protein
MPIISRTRFEDRIANFFVAPTSDFSVLLLAMELIAQHPSHTAGTGRDNLYVVTKTIFSQAQVFSPSSLYLVQAGVIIAHYEHAHGLLDAAYITIGTAARMACAMGLHEQKSSMEDHGTTLWMEQEEAICTWWGLVICDRYILPTSVWW